MKIPYNLLTMRECFQIFSPVYFDLILWGKVLIYTSKYNMYNVVKYSIL